MHAIETVDKSEGDLKLANQLTEVALAKKFQVKIKEFEMNAKQPMHINF